MDLKELVLEDKNLTFNLAISAQKSIEDVVEPVANVTSKYSFTTVYDFFKGMFYTVSAVSSAGALLGFGSGDIKEAIGLSSVAAITYISAIASKKHSKKFKENRRKVHQDYVTKLNARTNRMTEVYSHALKEDLVSSVNFDYNSITSRN